MHFPGKETVKTLIIVLLLLLVVLLSMAANYYSGASRLPALEKLAALFGSAAAQPPRQSQEPALTDASQPLLISIHGTLGRTSFWGDFNLLDSAFETFGGYLAEALDTAGAPEEITKSAFCAALKERSVYFAYPCDVPLGALSAWLDADAPLELSAGQFILSGSGSSVVLLLAGRDGFFRVSTEVDLTTFQSALESMPADGTFFALESQDPHYGSLDPLALVDLSRSAVLGGQGSNPCDDAFLTATAAALGFNPYGDSTYRDEADSTVYTEADCALRISAGGVLTLQNQRASSRFSAAGDSDGERIEYVRALLQRIAGSELGDGRLMLTGLSRDGEIDTVAFSYVLAGLPVELADGPAVTARFRGAVLTELTFQLRTYVTASSNQLGFLSAPQAAAILPEGAALRLAYADSGDGALQVGWLRGDPTK